MIIYSHLLIFIRGGNSGGDLLKVTQLQKARTQMEEAQDEYIES